MASQDGLPILHLSDLHFGSHNGFADRDLGKLGTAFFPRHGARSNRDRAPTPGHQPRVPPFARVAFTGVVARGPVSRRGHGAACGRSRLAAIRQQNGTRRNIDRDQVYGKRSPPGGMIGVQYTVEGRSLDQGLRRRLGLPFRSRPPGTVSRKGYGMFEATRQLIALAIAQRDALRDALGDDRANEDLRRQVETWQAAGGAYPSGRTGRLLDRWQRGGEFGRLCQRANAEAIQAGLGAFLLPKLEAVRDAHHLLLGEYRRRSEGEPADDWRAKERHAFALGGLIEVVNTLPAGEPADEDLPDEPVTPSKLADKLGIPKADSKAREALRKRLESWRNDNRNGGWIENANARGRQPRYHYPLRTVWPIVKDLRHSG